VAKMEADKKNKYIYRKFEEFSKNTTFMYRPPEMQDRYLKYDVDFKVDIWMLGCILYVLCFTKHPFQDAQTLAILNGSFEFPPQDESSHICEETKSLIKVMLRVNPAERPTIE